MIEGDRAELQHFAAGILERFYNPFIRHRLQSIALNSLSKWEARNFDTLKDNWQKASSLAEYEAFTFACLMALYAPESGFEPDDNAAHVEYIRSHWNDNDLETTIRSIVSESGIFVQNFESIVPGFSAKVAEYVADIRNSGIDAALNKFLSAHE